MTVSIGKIDAVGRSNIIGQRIVASGTVRAINDAVMDDINMRMTGPFEASRHYSDRPKKSMAVRPACAVPGTAGPVDSGADARQSRWHWS
jgi:hypothetical protein